MLPKLFGGIKQGMCRRPHSYETSPGATITLARLLNSRAVISTVPKRYEPMMTLMVHISTIAEAAKRPSRSKLRVSD
jgi:hypothetical protein